MKNRTRIQRSLLRRALRKELRHANESDSAVIQLALDDESMFETLYDTAMRQAKSYGESSSALLIVATGDGSLVVDNLLKLLQWFVENGPEFIEIINQIIGMFGTVDQAVELWESESLFVD